jgi:hypothetical protein
MAHISPNNIITINRGDTFNLNFYINIGTKVNPEHYILQGNDKLYLGVSEANATFENSLIKKVFTSSDVDSDGSINILFTTTDTLNLLPGNYYYSIKLAQPTEETSELAETLKVTTIIPKTKFIIIE